jgi:CheY-like chemotaxis protein
VATTKDILVVDDDRAVAGVLLRTLAMARLTGIWADPLTALRILKDEPGRIGIVVTDLHMPGMNGLVFANIVRTSWPDIALLLSTADPFGIDHRIFDAVLVKPFTGVDLMVAIHEATNHAEGSRPKRG